MGVATPADLVSSGSLDELHSLVASLREWMALKAQTAARWLDWPSLEVVRESLGPRVVLVAVLRRVQTGELRERWAIVVLLAVVLPSAVFDCRSPFRRLGSVCSPSHLKVHHLITVDL